MKIRKGFIMIRRAEARDLAAVNALLRQVLTVHANGRPDIFIPDTKKYADDELLALFKDDIRPVFVFDDEKDGVIGHAFCVIEETKNANNLRDMTTLYIDDICVDEAHRRLGVATALFEHVKAYAQSLGCYHITLNVWEMNPAARRFYERMGMKPLKTVMEAVL